MAGKGKGEGRTREDAPAGTTMRLDGKDGPQVVRTIGKRWSDAAGDRFIDCLGASCNVSLSAAEAGLSAEAFYARRRTDALFADRWRAALEQGCVRIETALIRAAAESIEGRPPDPEAPIPRMSVKEALSVLGHARASLDGDKRRPRHGSRVRSLDEVRASILVKLEAIEAARLRAGGDPLPARLEGAGVGTPNGGPSEDAVG